MAVKAEHACIHGKQYVKVDGGVGQAGGRTWHVWTTGKLAPLVYRVA
jgi:hypothetical protein